MHANDIRITVDQLRQVLAAQSPMAVNRTDGHQTQELNDLIQDVDEMQELVQLLSQQDAETDWARASASPETSTDFATMPAAQDTLVATQVVHMLVSNLRENPHVVQEVRDWVSNLQLPLERLARVDVSFLREKTHPARQMLDEVMQRSLAFATAQSDGFDAFFTPVRKYSEMVNAREAVSAQTFLDALGMMQHSWFVSDEEQRNSKEQAVQALLQAEQRNKLAGQIALELTRREDSRQAPIFLKQFLAGPWSQVLARARLHPVQANDSQRYVDLVGDLLWSANPHETIRNRNRLLRVIPALLLSLKEGLKGIDYPQHLSDEFLQQLMVRHEKALKVKARPKGSSTDSSTLETSAGSFQLREPVSRKQIEAKIDRTDREVSSPMWIAPREAHDSGFMMSEFDESLETCPRGLNLDLPKLGGWVDLLHSEQWVRVQLTWASPQGTLFMFTSSNGAPYSMTRRALDGMLMKGSLKVVEQANLVTGALNAVAQQAMKNTMGL